MRPRRSAAPARRDREAGFTMLAMVVVVGAIGALILVNQVLGSAQREQRMQTLTRDDMGAVVDALVAYAATHNRLPCPDTSSPPDGVAETTCTAAGSQTNGVVPWGTLGLGPADAGDRWGNLLAYRAEPEFTSTTSTLSGRFGSSTTTIGLTVCRTDSAPCGAADQIVGPLVTGDRPAGAFVLVSAGPSGRGGITDGGATTGAPPAGGREADNLTSPPNTYYDLPFTTRTAAGAELDPATATAHFDDIVETLSLQELMERAGLLTGGGAATPGNPSIAGMIDFSPKPLQLINEWSGAFDGWTATKNDTQRGYLPQVDADTGIIAFEDTRNLNNGEENQDHRACMWAQHALKLKDSVVRAYFDIAFEYDTLGTRKHGLVFAMLPWELRTRRDGYFSVDRCGQEGDYLGFASQNHSNTGMRNLYATSEFTGNPSDFREVMPFGVELDVWRSRGNITGRSFYDPQAAETSDRNHVAVVVDNVYHNSNFVQNEDTAANAECPDAGSTACFVPQGSAAADRLWLERGTSQWASVRVEVEDDTTACSAGQIHVRSWVWPAGVTKQDGYDDLTQNFTEEDANAERASYCVTKPTRTVSMGYGWTPSSWDAVRVGFTVGSPGEPSERSNPRLRNFVAGSFPKWPARPEGSAVASAQSQEIFNDRFGTTGASSLNWTILNSAGAQSNVGHSSMSWLAAPNLGFEILSYRGEIVATPSSGRWQEGFGVRGVGGAVSEWDIPPLDNIANAAHRGGPGTEEALSFHFDALYGKTRLLLGSLSSTERARIVVYQGGAYTKRAEYQVTGCNSGYGSVVNLDPTILFDSVYVEPLPAGADGLGAATSLYVRSVKACGDGVADCALDLALPPGDAHWMTTCTATATSVPNTP